MYVSTDFICRVFVTLNSGDKTMRFIWDLFPQGSTSNPSIKQNKTRKMRMSTLIVRNHTLVPQE